MTKDDLKRAYLEDGWCRFEHDHVLADWVAQTLPAARETLSDPEQAQWLRCGGTWFAGVNALPNGSTGAVPGGPDLGGVAVDFVRNELGLPEFAWERAQVSVCYPGYPQPMAGESDAAYRFRRDRDAAHVDGLIPERPHRRRYLREYHGFLLGIPMTETGRDASPFVVWPGSHHMMRDALEQLFAGVEPDGWSEVDVTDVYQAARRNIFETCVRVEVAAKPGEAYLVHRLALHGVAPWGEQAQSGPDGRMIVYFRPEIGGPEDWLRRP